MADRNNPRKVEYKGCLKMHGQDIGKPPGMWQYLRAGNYRCLHLKGGVPDPKNGKDCVEKALSEPFVEEPHGEENENLSTPTLLFSPSQLLWVLSMP